MIVILGYDGLEYDYVTEFGMDGLLQTNYGKTDLSPFTKPRTVVIWSSFITGRNTEKEAETAGLWGFKVDPKETFFSKFNKWKTIDVPGLSYKSEDHAKEREAMKLFFSGNMSKQEYDKIAFTHHKKNKEEFFEAINNEELDIIMGYFAIADVIGHTSFGNKLKMKLIYKDLERLREETIKRIPDDSTVLIISDHGMKPVGEYGDHSDHGFWSLNIDKNLGTPKPYDIAKMMGWW